MVWRKSTSNDTINICRDFTVEWHGVLLSPTDCGRLALVLIIFCLHLIDMSRSLSKHPRHTDHSAIQNWLVNKWTIEAVLRVFVANCWYCFFSSSEYCYVSCDCCRPHCVWLYWAERTHCDGTRFCLCPLKLSLIYTRQFVECWKGLGYTHVLTRQLASGFLCAFYWHDSSRFLSTTVGNKFVMGTCLISVCE